MRRNSSESVADGTILEYQEDVATVFVCDMRDRNDGTHVSLRRSVRDVNWGNGISDGKSISALIPNDCQGFCECVGTL